MFYRPEDGHGLPHNPFSAIVNPRPIAWVGTRGAMGDNLAPYSFFNGVAYDPPQVMFSTTGSKPDRLRGKDTLGNIEQTGVFCVNVVEEEGLEQEVVSFCARPGYTIDDTVVRPAQVGVKKPAAV